MKPLLFLSSLLLSTAVFGLNTQDPDRDLRIEKRIDSVNSLFVNNRANSWIELNVSDLSPEDLRQFSALKGMDELIKSGVSQFYLLEMQLDLSPANEVLIIPISNNSSGYLYKLDLDPAHFLGEVAVSHPKEVLLPPNTQKEKAANETDYRDFVILSETSVIPYRYNRWESIYKGY